MLFPYDMYNKQFRIISTNLQYSIDGLLKEILCTHHQRTPQFVIFHLSKQPGLIVLSKSKPCDLVSKFNTAIFLQVNTQVHKVSRLSIFITYKSSIKKNTNTFETTTLRTKRIDRCRPFCLFFIFCLEILSTKCT